VTPGADVVLRFLRSVGQRAEVDFYVDLFRSQEDGSFAILSVAGPIDRDLLDVDLRYLRQLGLEPVIADDQADLAALAVEQRARKVVFLGPWRGLEPAGRPRPSLVDLNTEYDALRAELPAPQVRLLDEAQRIIDAVPPPITVAVTSPLQLLRELFTVKGSGTLVRRGARIQRVDSFDQLDSERLGAVIESAFGGPAPAELYERPVERVYIAGDYRGAAIVSPSEIGPYLTKFAVDRGAQGEGIGRDLWRALVADCDSLHWRCRPANPIASWYAKQCDGLVRTDDWHVFWRGVPAQRIPDVIERCRSLPRDFA